MKGLRFIIIQALFFSAVWMSSGQPPRSCLIVSASDSLTAEPLAGVVVEVLDDGMALKSYALTGDDGVAEVSGICNGRYILRLSILGYETKSFPVEKTSDIFDAGICLMHATSIAIKAAVHAATALRASQSGDTITYNAASYKVPPGADTESLVSRMPGIVLTDAGVNAHGQDVRVITIDGKDFFSDDVMTALKNIPADMVREIEVVNRKSDLAELSGTDDGNSYTAINIVTKPEARDGMLAGKIYGGYGIIDKYIAGTGLNWFDKKYSLSMLAMSNNMNRFNFMADDITGSGGSSSTGKSFRLKELAGLSEVHSAGINFSNDWFTGSYFFGYIDNENDSDNYRRRNESPEKMLLTDQSTSSHARNRSHQFSSRIKFSPSKRHSIIIRPQFNIQDNTGGNIQTSMYTSLFTDGSNEFIRNRLSENSSDKWSVAASLRLSYTYRFAKRGRTLSVSASCLYNGGSSGTKTFQHTFRDPDVPLEPEMATSYSAQRKDYSSGRIRTNGTVVYTEPVGKRSRLSLELKAAWDRSDADNMVFLHDKEAGTYSDIPDSRQSALNTSSFLTGGANVRYNWYFRKMAVTASAGWQNVRFNSSVTLPYVSVSGKDFNDAVYRLVVNLPFTKSHSLRIEARSRTSNPSATRLQDVVNLANMSNIRAGNPGLVPSYINDMSARYVFTDSRTASTLSVNAAYSFSHNYVSDSLVVDSPGFQVTEEVILGEGDQYIKPVNMKGYRRFSGSVICGVPLGFIRCNLGITAGLSISRLPSMVNGVYSPVRRDWYSAGTSLTSNISENVDFSLGYSFRANVNSQKTAAGRLDNNFLVHRVAASLKVIFWKGLVFTGNLIWRQDRSLDGRFNDRTCLCDLYIGKRLFKDRLGEISLGVTDLFNGNARRYTHSIGTSGTNDGSYPGLGRYFSVRFTYDLRVHR